VIYTLLHLKIDGEKQVIVDDKTIKPALLNPEASIKIGLRL